VGISGCDRIGEIEAAIGITHLLASTFVLGHAFHVIRTPSIPSGSAAAAVAMSDAIASQSVSQFWELDIGSLGYPFSGIEFFFLGFLMFLLIFDFG